MYVFDFFSFSKQYIVPVESVLNGDIIMSNIIGCKAYKLYTNPTILIFYSLKDALHGHTIHVVA